MRENRPPFLILKINLQIYLYTANQNNEWKLWINTIYNFFDFPHFYPLDKRKFCIVLMYLGTAYLSRCIFGWLSGWLSVRQCIEGSWKTTLFCSYVFSFDSIKRYAYFSIQHQHSTMAHAYIFYKHIRTHLYLTHKLIHTANIHSREIIRGQIYLYRM